MFFVVVALETKLSFKNLKENIFMGGCKIEGKASKFK
jgi:hypothetical protein